MTTRRYNDNDQHGTLKVRNIEQAAAWLEIDGQLSDGKWENATPHDHWIPWCDARVVVASSPASLGRDFSARKDNYNLLDKELLDVVGLRMLGIVRIARAFGIKVASKLEHSVDCDGKLDYPKYEAEWAEQIRATIDLVGREKLVAALADTTYTMNDLRADLRDLKATMKIRRQAVRS